MGGSAKFDSPKIFGGLNMVQLFDVNEQNWLDIFSLSVTKEQKRFLSTPEFTVYATVNMSLVLRL